VCVVVVWVCLFDKCLVWGWMAWRERRRAGSDPLRTLPHGSFLVTIIIAEYSMYVCRAASTISMSIPARLLDKGWQSKQGLWTVDQLMAFVPVPAVSASSP
jgi:hypothetical protein